MYAVQAITVDILHHNVWITPWTCCLVTQGALKDCIFIPHTPETCKAVAAEFMNSRKVGNTFLTNF